MTPERFRRPPGSKPIAEMTSEERREYDRESQARFRRKLGHAERTLLKHGSIDEMREYYRQAQARFRAKRRRILAAAKRPIECPHCGNHVRLSF